MVLTAFSKSFSNEKFKGNEPSSQPILRVLTLWALLPSELFLQQMFMVYPLGTSLVLSA